MARFSLVLLSLMVPAAAMPVVIRSPIPLAGTIINWPSPGSTAIFDAGDGDVVDLHGTVTRAAIGPVAVQNAYRVLDVIPPAQVGQLLVEGIRARVTDACVRARGDTVVVRGTHCTMVGGPQTGPVNMPFGLEVITARHVLVEDSSFDGFQWTTSPSGYWNGDGITMERDVQSAEFRRVSSNDNSDAGFDIRPYARLSDVFASGNCRNFRFWNGADVGTITSGRVVWRGGISSCSGIWLNGAENGAPPRLHIRKLVVRMPRPGTIIEVETGPANISIDECDIKAAKGTIMVEFDRSPGKLSLGKGCRVG